ncbi:MAG: hypothetical protein Q4C91_10985 [Eubacteriales bacterium]|nr:hypothetical protein [Eubacteriales bacterium]
MLDIVALSRQVFEEILQAGYTNKSGRKCGRMVLIPKKLKLLGVKSRVVHNEAYLANIPMI